MKKLLMQHEEKMRSDTAGGEKKRGFSSLSFKQLRVKPYNDCRSCLSMLSSVCMSDFVANSGRLKLEPLSADAQYSAPVTTGRQVCLPLVDLRIFLDATQGPLWQQCQRAGPVTEESRPASQKCPLNLLCAARQLVIRVEV